MTEHRKALAHRVLLAEIAGAHGIRGAVLIKTYMADPQSIAAYGALEDEAGRRKFEIRIERVAAKGVIGHIAGVSDRSQAEKLKGVKLYVAREQLPETRAGEFYYADLIGLAAVDGAGAVIGEVVTVANYGASDVLEIRLAGSKKTELLPFTEAFVSEVDLSARRIVVSMPVESRDVESPDDDQSEER